MSHITPVISVRVRLAVSTAGIMHWCFDLCTVNHHEYTLTAVALLGSEHSQWRPWSDVLIANSGQDWCIKGLFMTV